MGSSAFYLFYLYLFWQTTRNNFERMITRQGKVLKYSQLCNMQTYYFIICLLKLPVIVNTGITLLIHVYTVGVSSQCCWVSTTHIIINTAEIINKQAEISLLRRCISAWDYQVYSSSCTDPWQTVDMSHLQPTRPNLGSGCHEAKSFFLFFHWSANRVPSTVSSL